MRNESSASETTPLRRPESESPDNVAQNHGQLTVVNNNHSNSNNNNSNYGDSVTVRLQDNNEDNNIQQQQSKATNMDTNKRILCRVGLDVLILLCGKLWNLFNYTCSPRNSMQTFNYLP